MLTALMALALTCLAFFIYEIIILRKERHSMSSSLREWAARKHHALALQIDPGAKLIVSSAYSDDPIIANYRDYGLVARISKPYTRNELSAVRHEVFEARTTRSRPPVPIFLLLLPRYRPIMRQIDTLGGAKT